MSKDKHRFRDRLIKEMQENFYTYGGELCEYISVNLSCGGKRIQDWMKDAMKKGYLKRERQRYTINSRSTQLKLTDKGKAFLRRYGDLVPTGYRC